MLKRILTAGVLLPFIIWTILFSSTKVFLTVATVLVFMAFWEVCRMLRFSSQQTLFYFSFFGGALIMTTAFSLTYLLPFVCMFWLGSLGFLYVYPKFPKILASKLGMSFLSFWVLIPFWDAMISLRYMSSDRLLLLFPCMIVWMADTGAYFIGRHFGHRLLAKEISPKKTWEGMIGGVFFSSWFGIYFLMQCQFFGMSPKWMSMLVVLTALISVVGDLFESMFKRQVDVKDSGVMLPGHGGIYDRIDSLTAALPIFLSGVVLIKVMGA